MDCNRECYWNYDGACCYEGVAKNDLATGNENYSLWIRHDKYFVDIYDYIENAIEHMNVSKLEQVKHAIDQINIECETKAYLERGGYSFGSCNICKTKECKYNPNISIAEKFNRLINNNDENKIN